MAKLNTGSVRPGDQIDSLMELPAEALAQSTPQSNIFSGPEAAQEIAAAAAMEAPTQESPISAEMAQVEADQEMYNLEAMSMPPEEQAYQMALQEQSLESQQVLPITERREDTRVTSWDISPLSEQSADGGLTERAVKLNSAIDRGITSFKDTSNLVRPAVESTTATNIKNVMSQTGALNQDVTSNLKVDPMFSSIVALYAEDYFATKTIGEDPSLLDPEEQPESEMFGMDAGAQLAQVPNMEIKKADDPRRLGQEIHKEYQRYKGVPEAEIQPLDDTGAAFLGDYAKEVYAESVGPENITRETVYDQKTKKSSTSFYMTPLMVKRLQSSQAYRDQIMPKKFVRPNKAPTRGAQVVGDMAGFVKRVSGQVVKGRITSREIEEAIENSGSVPHVVRPERLRILFSTILPALMSDHNAYGQDALMDMFAEINNFGPSKLQKYLAVQNQKGGQGYDANQEMAKLKNVIAQQILGIAMEKDGANYLQYFMQAFNGRLTPQASLFNPTTSKAVRFVTSNATPTAIKPQGKMVEAAFQAYALVIGAKGTDGLLPKERKHAILKQAPQLEAWGDRLAAVMDESMTNEEADAVAKAIAAGIPMNDPKFPRVKPMALDPQRDADLIAAIKAKGEDGPAYIDGLIDFAKFRKAMRDGKTYYSYLNPTIDGKTNGPASNGMQMGDEKIAYRTGVLRTKDSMYAVQDDMDIRDELQDILLADIEQGFSGHFKDEADETLVVGVAKAVVTHRPLNKAMTMTFGYGKDFPSFKKDIVDTIYELAETNPKVREALAVINSDGSTLDMDQVADMILGKYIPAVAQVMSEDGIVARHLLWGTALVSSLADIPIEMRGPTGLLMAFGGKAPYTSESVGKYKLQGREINARTYESKPTAAAVKSRTDNNGEVTEDVGGTAWGGIIPGPVQAIDAATVIKTFSGKSWQKIKQATGNKPYVHQIYDAFKFDIATYAVAAEEVNRNWAKVSLEWSYLNEAEMAVDRAIKELQEKANALPKGSSVQLSTDPMLESLLGKSYKQKDGKIVYPSLLQKLKKLSPYVDPTQQASWAQSAHDAIVRDASLDKYAVNPTNIKAEHVKSFYGSLFKTTKLKSRIRQMREKTDKKKAELARKVLSKDNNIFQYYAH